MIGVGEKLPVESQLLAQLVDIERRLADLEAERAAVQRILFRVRQQNPATHDVTRRSSFDRLLVEDKILDILRNSEGYVRVDEIHQAVRSVVRDLKSSTFRSYLHRMKEKGLIEASYARGHWRIIRNPIP